MTNRFHTAGLLLIAIAAAGCSGRDLQPALQSIAEKDLAADVAILASDDFEGRAPASAGEEKTINFLKEEFQKIGLRPGSGETYFQEVPLVSITANPQIKLNIKSEDGHWAQTLDFGKNFIAWTKRVMNNVSINNSEMIFIGYGVVAPEYEWNDYAGLDVRGKTVVILVNDPGYATGDSSLFNGRTMTYYGRWTYKFEEAARQGAEAAFVIHETAPASYPWEVVTGSWGGPQFDLVREDNNLSRCALEGWISLEAAQQIFEKTGLNYATLKAAAGKRGFQAAPFEATASITIDSDIRFSKSNNVLGLLPGKTRPDEYVFYMAHWDHFGKNALLEGDQIYNGALDNATGVAGLLEIAEAFTKLSEPPERSIVFMAVTAEEQGLIGSEYYANNPVYPLTKTVAAINMDALNINGKMNDIVIVGYGNSDLDDYVKKAAAEDGRTVRPDPEPEKGYFYRSDHFSFAKQGVPALYTDPGIDHVEKGEKWTLEQRDKYTAGKYHKPADEFDPNWDLSGAVQDLRLLFKVGYRLGNESSFPNWKPGTEFKTKRDADMQAAGFHTGK